MSENVATIEAFLGAFNRKDVDAIMGYFGEDAVYHNMPMQPVQGHDAIRKVVEMFLQPAETVDWELTHIAEVGGTVLTERVDRFVIGGQDVILPIMGAFDLKDGKIAAWRDYFDLATWQRQQPKAS